MHRKLVLFAVQLEGYLAHFPNCHKHALTQAIRLAFLDVYNLVTEAQKRYHKKTTLTQLDVRHEQLRMMIHLAHELGLFGFSAGLKNLRKHLLCRDAFYTHPVIDVTVGQSSFSSPMCNSHGASKSSDVAAGDLVVGLGVTSRPLAVFRAVAKCRLFALNRIASRARPHVICKVLERLHPAVTHRHALRPVGVVADVQRIIAASLDVLPRLVFSRHIGAAVGMGLQLPRFVAIGFARLNLYATTTPRGASDAGQVCSLNQLGVTAVTGAQPLRTPLVGVGAACRHQQFSESRARQILKRHDHSFLYGLLPT